MTSLPRRSEWKVIEEPWIWQTTKFWRPKGFPDDWFNDSIPKEKLDNSNIHHIYYSIIHNPCPKPAPIGYSPVDGTIATDKGWPKGTCNCGERVPDKHWYKFKGTLGDMRDQVIFNTNIFQLIDDFYYVIYTRPQWQSEGSYTTHQLIHKNCPNSHFNTWGRDVDEFPYSPLRPNEMDLENPQCYFCNKKIPLSYILAWMSWSQF